MLKAVTRQASLVDQKLAFLNASLISQGKPKVSTAYYFDHFATAEDIAVMVSEEDFLAAEKELVPSVSWGELEHYKKVRGLFEGNGNGSTEKNPDVKGKGKFIEGRMDMLDNESEGGRSPSPEYSMRPVSSGGTATNRSSTTIVSNGSSTGAGSLKGKGKGLIERLGGKGKGKMKAEPEDEVDEEEKKKVNWISIKGKGGKGKEVMRGNGNGNGGSLFEEGSVEDEESLY